MIEETATKHSYKYILVFIAVALLSTLIPSISLAQAASSTSTKAGDYTIHHTVFNSSFLSPEIAAIYGLTRGADKAIVNVAVTKAGVGGESLGLPAQVEGVARNLMQQSTELNFTKIQEQDATYYIAPFEFDDQEIMHFYIDVLISGEKFSKEVKFTKKLYHD